MVEKSIKKQTLGNIWLALIILGVVLTSALYVITPEWRFQQFKRHVESHGRQVIESLAPKSEK